MGDEVNESEREAEPTERVNVEGETSKDAEDSVTGAAPTEATSGSAASEPPRQNPTTDVFPSGPRRAPSGGLKPLPSIKQPLLNDQLEAQRTRRMVLGGLLVSAIVVGGLVTVFTQPPEAPPVEPPPEPEALIEGLEPPPVIAVDGGPPEPESAPEEEVAPEPVAEAPEAEGATQRFEATFGNARAFRSALRAAGLSDTECASLETALADVLDFRRCQPEHRIVYERGPAGQLMRFAYHDQNRSYAEVLVDGEGAMSARRVERQLEVFRRLRTGRVTSSLGDAVMRAGLERGTVGVFIEVFDGRVNFSTQARAGDTFKVLIDEEYLDGQRLGFGEVHALEYIGENAGTLRAYWFDPRGRRGNWYDDTGREIRGGWLRVPCRYDRISSPFNPRRMHPVLRRIVPHNGVDLAAATGTPVWAAADGVVTWAAPKGPNGNLVSIRHADGYSTHYAHLHRIQRGIREGVEVTQRQLIGAVGTTGRSTGPHLHFGLKRNGRFLNPIEILNGPGRRLPGGQMGAFRRRMRELDAALDAEPESGQ